MRYDKERYIEILTQNLNEYYKEIKRKNSGSENRQKYIDGYLTAARALGAFDYKELKELIDKIHLQAFGKTIEERRQSKLSEPSSNNDILDIPTFIREGISLDKG
jgi:hypothetical protein